VATLVDGTRQVEWMDKDELFKVRERSETYSAYLMGKIKSCTWVTDESEMMRKTVIKRIYKYLPRTEKMEQIDNAVSLDNSDYSASDNQLQYIESLLHTSTLEQRQVDAIEMEMTVMNSKRASEVISMLQINQQGDTLKQIQRGAKVAGAA
jgi:recombinational DNA repair protein RecT